MAITLLNRIPASAQRQRADFVDASALSGCPPRDLKSQLRDAGLRPTRQRLALGWLMFGKGDRHLTAEMLYDEASKAKIPVSLATVYNTLNQFSEAGLLREIAVDGSRTYFDTRLSEHHHFFFEDTNEMVDLSSEAIAIGSLPQAPEGYSVARVEVVVRLRKNG